MVEKQKFRVSLCTMMFYEVELEAENIAFVEAEARKRTFGHIKLECAPVAHKIERRVPVPGQPGEFRWQEVERA